MATPSTADQLSSELEELSMLELPTFSPKKEPFETEYELLELLGKGAFATVHLCKSKKDGQKYAVKIIQKASNAKDVIESEVRIMSLVKHINIVRLVDLFEKEDAYFVVLELITGGELFDKIIELSNYAEKDAARVMKQLFSALDYLHTMDIVHRDLKPENLLLSSKRIDADIKLADFGLAKWLRDHPEGLTNCAGTPGYLAPEVLEAYYTGVPYGKGVDLWSAGVIMYILIYGSPPFYEEDQDLMFEKIRVGDFYFPDMPVSDTAMDLMKHLIIVDPAQRMTAKEALAHPWIAGAEANAHPLPAATMDSLKKFVARKRFKGAINAVRAINKIKSSLSASGFTPSNKTSQPAPNATTNANANATTTTTPSTPASTSLTSSYESGSTVPNTSLTSGYGTSTDANKTNTTPAQTAPGEKKPKIQVQMSLMLLPVPPAAEKAPQS